MQTPGRYSVMMCQCEILVCSCHLVTAFRQGMSQAVLVQGYRFKGRSVTCL